MSSKTKTQEVREFIEKTKRARAEEIAVREADLEKAEAELTVATKAFDEAIRSGDPEAYRAAKQSRESKADAVELFKTRLYQLKNDGSAMISDEEYESMKAGIFAELSALCAEQGRKVEKVFRDLEKIEDGLYKALEEGNAVLKELQSDVYRNKDRRKTKFGELVLADEIRFNDYALSQFLEDAITRAKTAGIIQ